MICPTYILILKALKFVADVVLNFRSILRLFFQRQQVLAFHMNRLLDMNIVICIKCLILLSGKNISICRLLKILSSMLSINKIVLNNF